MNNEFLFTLILFIFILKPIKTTDAYEENNRENETQILSKLSEQNKLSFSEQLDVYYEEHNDSIETFTLNEVKKREGLKLHVYRCSAGKRTIGHGHVIKGRRDYHLLKGITVEQADSLLRHDFNYVKRHLQKTLNLKGYRLYAMTAFCFNLGPFKLDVKTGKKLRSLIENNEPIDKEIVKFYCYKSPKTGNYIKSKYLLKARKWELALYNKHDSLKRAIVKKANPLNKFTISQQKFFYFKNISYIAVIKKTRYSFY